MSGLTGYNCYQFYCAQLRTDQNTHVRSGSNFSVLLNRLDMAVPACPESLLICGEDLLLVWSLEEQEQSLRIFRTTPASQLACTHSKQKACFTEKQTQYDQAAALQKMTRRKPTAVISLMRQILKRSGEALHVKAPLRQPHGALFKVEVDASLCGC